MNQEPALDFLKTQPIQAQQVLLDFVSLVEGMPLVAGTDVLLLVSDPWYRNDEILNVTWDGENFIYRNRKLEGPCIKFIVGMAALPYRLPYLSSESRFVSR